MKRKDSLFGVGLLLSGILLSAGTAWLFPTCGPGAGGGWMKCHWSGQVVIGTGVILILIAIAYLAAGSKEGRVGLHLSAAFIAAFDIAVLNGLVGLCGMAEMQCRAVTEPAVTIICAAVILGGIANAVWVLWSKRRKEAAAV